MSRNNDPDNVIMDESVGKMAAAAPGLARERDDSESDRNSAEPETETERETESVSGSDNKAEEAEGIMISEQTLNLA